MTDKELREKAENVWRDGQDAFFSQQEIKGDGCDAATPIIAAALKDAYREGVEDMRDAANRKIAKYYGGLAATHVFIGLADVTDEAARLLGEKP